MIEAAERADQLLDEGDMAGAETWHRILNAIEWLRAKAPEGGRRCVEAFGNVHYRQHARPSAQFETVVAKGALDGRRTLVMEEESTGSPR
jgi:hypothetical protein